eukprot:60095-Pyramimonas_sp.AAC.1
MPPPEVSMYLDGRQVCSIPAGWFHDRLDAVKLMITIGEEFVAKKVEKDDLYPKRDELFAK